MILKLREVEPLFKALTALDGNPPFKFSVKVTWNKAKNLHVLKKTLQRIDEARTAIIKPLIPEGEVAVPKERIEEFVKAFNELLETEEEIPGMLQLDPCGLNIFDPTDNPSGNVIPSSVLEAVMPLFPCDTQ